MNMKLTILRLSESIKWNNWPTLLKGFFLLWPTLGPVYLFLFRTPSPVGGEGGTTALMTNIEYQNYFIVVFLGFWSINILLLGLTWVIGSLTSKTYRSYLKEKSRVKSSQRKKTSTVGKVVKEYPMLVKKGSRNELSGGRELIKKRYQVLRKRSRH